MALRVVLIGATGVFGSRIARRLAGDPRFMPVLAGRQRPALEALREELGDASMEVATLDVAGLDLPAALARLAPQLVIHTAGPFQGQDYRVAEACLACGSDYIDLADGRDFVSGIGSLDERAREAGRLLVSGASSVLVTVNMEDRFAVFPTMSAIFCAAISWTYSPTSEMTVSYLSPSPQRGQAIRSSDFGSAGPSRAIWQRAQRTFVV